MNHPKRPVAQVDHIAGSWEEPAVRLAPTLTDPNTAEFRQQQLATATADVRTAIRRAATAKAMGARTDRDARP